jgi:hypothetical protein
MTTEERIRKCAESMRRSALDSHSDPVAVSAYLDCAERVTRLIPVQVSAPPPPSPRAPVVRPPPVRPPLERLSDEGDG